MGLKKLMDIWVVSGVLSYDDDATVQPFMSFDNEKNALKFESKLEKLLAIREENQKKNLNELFNEEDLKLFQEYCIYESFTQKHFGYSETLYSYFVTEKIPLIREGEKEVK